MMARKTTSSDMATRKLCALLRESRLKKGFSQAELADIFGYESAQYISDWERGVSSPPMKKLAKIVEALDIDMDRLFDLLLEVAKERVTGDLKREFSRIKKQTKR